MRMSKFSLHDEDAREKPAEDPINAIYGIIREDIVDRKKETYSWDEIVSLCGHYTVSLTNQSQQFQNGRRHIVP